MVETSEGSRERLAHMKWECEQLQRDIKELEEQFGDTTIGQSHGNGTEASPRAGGNRVDVSMEDERDRKTSRPENPEDIRRLMKALQQKRFEPLTEETYDDVLEEWSRLTLGSGYELETLKHVVWRLSPSDIQDAILVQKALEKPWLDFVDSVARELFPHSVQIDEICQRLDAEERTRPFAEAVRRFEALATPPAGICLGAGEFVE